MHVLQYTVGVHDWQSQSFNLLPHFADRTDADQTLILQIRVSLDGDAQIAHVLQAE